MISLVVIGICTATMPNYTMEDKMDCIIEARECLAMYDIYQQDEIETVEKCAQIIAENFDDGHEWGL